MYTLAIKHNACPLVGGKRDDDMEHERTSQPVLTQCTL